MPRPLTENIRHIRLAGAYSNNKMERMNGEIRDADSFKVLSSFGQRVRPITHVRSIDQPLQFELWIVFIR